MFIKNKKRKQASSSAENSEKPIELNRFRIKSGMTKNTGLLRFARNDVKLLVPQCLRNLVSSPQDPTPKSKISTLPQGAGIPVTHLFTPKKKAAFTLAEVLITLGIIGVVAAMTIPGLITAQKAKRLHSQYFKAYSEVAQAIKMMKYDERSLDPKSYAGADKQDKFVNVFSSYFKVLHRCGDNAEINQAKNKMLCYQNGDGTYKTLDGNGIPNWNLFDDGQFVLMDGALVMLENPYSVANAPIWITVDINGKNEKPNRWGYDVFTFVINDNEELIPMGERGTSYTDLNSYCNPKKYTGSINGIACAYKAQTDSSYFKSVVNTLK